MSVEIFTTDDTGELEELSAADGWDLRCTQLEPGPIRSRYEIATLDEINVHWERHRCGLAYQGAPPPNTVPFQILISAAACSLHGREIRPWDSPSVPATSVTRDRIRTVPDHASPAEGLKAQP